MPSRRRPVVRPGRAALALAVALAAWSPAWAVEPSSRIVSIGGSITEIVYALGLGDRLVAVDITSFYPPEATKKPNVGYVRQLAAEPILALTPTVVLAEADAGPPPVIDQLREAKVNLVLVPDDPSPQGVLDKIASVSRALGQAERGRALSARLSQRLGAIARAISAVPDRPRVLFLLSVGQGGAPLAGGLATSADGIIALAGGTNAASAFERYRPLSPEAAVAMAPEFILVTDRSLGILGGMDKLRALPHIATTPAGRDGRIVVMDGLLLLGFGPRLDRAVRELAAALHPALDLPAMDD